MIPTNNYISLEYFFSKYIEGYLLGDLEAMSKITADPITHFGGVTYPMIQSTNAGIELLGNLILQDNEEFNKNHGNKYFLHFWNNYLVKINPYYKNLGNLFYNLVRHGIAHTFLVKHGIFTAKNRRQVIEIDRQQKTIIVDCVLLYKDFQDAYEKFVKPILKHPEGTEYRRMDSRFRSLVLIYQQDADHFFDEYINQPSVVRGENLPSQQSTLIDDTAVSGNFLGASSNIFLANGLNEDSLSA